MNVHQTTVSVDKLTLLRRYPSQMMHAIIDAAADTISVGDGWYYDCVHKAGAAYRLRMALPDEYGERSSEFADLRFYVNIPNTQKLGNLRIEWNPAKAGPAATTYILQELTAFLPDTTSELLSNAYVTRLDLAVDVPAISCRHLAAQRTSHHKNAEVFVGAGGHVNSIRIGARGSSAKTGTFMRVYEKDLPTYSGASGVRAEDEISRPGPTDHIHQMKNPFDKFRIYQFPPAAADHGVFACFVSAAREKGVKRAPTLLSHDEAAEFQAILDQSSAPWWAPGELWDRGKECTAGVFGHTAPGADAASIGKAA